MNKLPIIALIGRANVGKSTLFNTLIEERKAIVSNIAGTTRDRNYATVNWRDLSFKLVDTGGIDIVHPQDIEKDILKQADYALSEADLIIFLVDAQSGIMPQDKKISLILKKNKKPVILVANKADNRMYREALTEFYRLSAGEPVPVSAINGSGTGDLLDKINLHFKNWKKAEITADNQSPIKIAVIGKPNTGKSTFINSLLGEDRVITSPQPYTTRDAQHIDFNYKNRQFTMIDTAGIRKTAKVRNRLEKVSVNQSLKSIRSASISLLMTDVSEPLGRQDKILADEILQSRNSLIIIANKWDLISDKDSATVNKFTRYYYQFFPFLSFAPIIFISALEKQRVRTVLDLALEVYEERFREITDNALDKFLKKIIKLQPPSRGKGVNHPKIYQLKQLGVDPPEFEILKDLKSDLHDSYLKFIENQLRLKFGFKGTPVIIKVRRLKNL